LAIYVAIPNDVGGTLPETIAIQKCC